MLKFYFSVLYAGYKVRGRLIHNLPFLFYLDIRAYKGFERI
jgi:hypothetical protein